MLTSGDLPFRRSEDGEHAAVDVQDLAVDEVRGRAARNSSGAHEVLDLAPPAGGGRPANPCAELLVGHQRLR